MRNGVEYLQFVLRANHDLIKGADQKISIFLAFLGFFIPLVYFPFLQFVLKNFLILDLTTFILFELGFIFLTLTLLKTLWGLIPTLSKRSFPKSLIYFGDIAAMKFSDFKIAVAGLSDAKFKEDLRDQVYITSKIAQRKHSHFDNAVWLFYLSLAFSFASGFNLILKLYA